MVPLLPRGAFGALFGAPLGTAAEASATTARPRWVRLCSLHNILSKNTLYYLCGLSRRPRGGTGGLSTSAPRPRAHWWTSHQCHPASRAGPSDEKMIVWSRAGLSPIRAARVAVGAPDKSFSNTQWHPRIAIKASLGSLRGRSRHHAPRPRASGPVGRSPRPSDRGTGRGCRRTPANAQRGQFAGVVVVDSWVRRRRSGPAGR